MLRESPALGTVNRGLIRPGPSAKLRATVVGVRLPEFLLAVHDERTMLCHRFTDGTSLQHQQFARCGAVDNLDGLPRIDFDG